MAKLDTDRDALREVVKSGNPKFFLGSDSAPHPKSKKGGCCAAAGIFTQPWLLAYLADTLERIGCLPRLFDFACNFGSAFFGLTPHSQISLRLVRRKFLVPDLFECDGGLEPVIPYRAGETLASTLENI